MVGGLVEEEEIRPEEEEAGEGGAHAPASRELGERPMRVRGGEPQPAEDDLGLRLQTVATERLEAVLDLAVALGGCLGGRGIGHQGGEALQLRLEAPDLVEAGERLGEDGPRLARPYFLWEIPDADSAVAMHAAGVRLLHAGEDAAESRLAGAIGAAETNALTAADAPRYLAEQHLSSVSLGDGVEGYHAIATPCPWSGRGRAP